MRERSIPRAGDGPSSIPLARSSARKLAQKMCQQLTRRWYYRIIIAVKSSRELSLRTAPYAPVVPPEKHLELTRCQPTRQPTSRSQEPRRRRRFEASRPKRLQAEQLPRAAGGTLATAPKKPAAELTFKEAWLSDPATHPIVAGIISST